MKKTAEKVLMFLVLGAVFLGLGWGGYRILREQFLYANGRLLARNEETVDLAGKPLKELQFLRELPNMRQLNVRNTGLSIEDYEWLRREFPGCDIYWDVPFQGGCYPNDTRKLRLTSLSEEEIPVLDYLPELTSIDAWDCPDLEQLFALQQRRPECRVFYDVPLCGQEWTCDTVYMTVLDADAGELMEKLRYLPRLESLLLTGVLPEGKALQELMTAYPAVEISWLVEVDGKSFPANTQQIDLRDVKLDSPEEAARILAGFPVLIRADLSGCGFGNDQMLALADQFPETELIWDMTIGDLTVSTGTRELDLSGQPLGDTEDLERLLPYFPDLEKVVLCGCGLESQAVAALQQRQENIRFVWDVNLAGLITRTDATYFMPNKYGAKCTDANIADLRYCVDMVCVDVGHAEKVTGCEWAAFMPKLRYLILADSGVGDISPLSGLTELVFLELFQSRVKDYSPLLTCTALEDLNLCYTYGSPEPIGEMTWLKRLWWSGSWAARTQLPEKLPDTLLEFDTLSSTGDGWREGQHYYDMRDIVGMGYMTG